MEKMIINDLLHGLEESPVSLIGDNARSVVVKERDTVLRFLDSGGTAYGFSTFLGIWTITQYDRPIPKSCSMLTWWGLHAL